MKRKSIIIIATLIVLITTSVVYGSSVKNNLFDVIIIRMKDQVIKSKKDPKKDDIVLKIDDREITKEQFDLKLSVEGTENVEDVVENFVVNTAKRKLIKKYNINVSDEEVYNFIERQKSLVIEEDKEKIAKLSEALGLNGPYWESDYAFDAYKYMLEQGKLFNIIFEDIKTENPGNEQNELIELARKEFDKIVEEEKQKLKIEKNY